MGGDLNARTFLLLIWLLMGLSSKTAKLRTSLAILIPKLGGGLRKNGLVITVIKLQLGLSTFRRSGKEEAQHSKQ